MGEIEKEDKGKRPQMGKMSLKLDFSKPLNLGGLNLSVDKQT